MKINGIYETRTFNNNDDVWEVIDLIIEETKEMNESHGKSFDVAASIQSQLPFFSCNNIMFDKDIQLDIERYIYCEDFKTSPYPGSFDEQPSKWIQKSFVIKKAINKIKNKAIKDGTT